jgi:N-acetylneuraminic acid mutarotase
MRMPRKAHLRRVFWTAIASVLGGGISHATAQPVDFSDWHATFGFQGERTSHAGVLINNRVYILGGLAYTSNVVLYDDVQSATLGNDGSIVTGSWRRVGSLPTARSGLGAAYDQGMVYVVGGYSDAGTLGDTHYAALKPDGAISSWVRGPNLLNTPRSNHSVQIFKTNSGKRYLITIAGVGNVGQDTVHFDTIEVAAIASDGSAGPWHTCPYHLKGGRSAPATLIANGNLYVLGGWGDLLIEDVFKDVQFAPLRDDGCPDPWHTSLYTLNMPLYGATAALTSVSGSPVAIVLGGNAGQGNYFNNVQFAPILKDGSTGTFTFDTHQFAIARWGHVTVLYNNFLYVIGGARRGESGYLSDVQVSTLTGK